MNIQDGITIENNDNDKIACLDLQIVSVLHSGKTMAKLSLCKKTKKSRKLMLLMYSLSKAKKSITQI